MCFWLVILGVYMGWLESVTRDKPRDIPETEADTNTYLWDVDIPMDIPEHLRAEPAVKEAERVVRSRR